MPTSTTQVSVGELIRLAFPAGTPVPPPRFRSRLVNWVTMAGPGVVPAAGDFLLCTDFPPPEVLAAWSGAGATGAAGAGALPAVDRLDMPLIVLPPGASLRDIQQSALQLIVNRQSYLMERGGRVHHTLARKSVEGVGLDGLAQAMLELTGNTVLVQDKRLQTLAQAVAPGLAAQWPALLARLGQPSQLPEALRDRREAAAGGWRDQPLPDGLMRLVCPVIAKGMARGYLSLVGPAAEMDALDHLVVEQGAAACALEMAKAKAVSDVEKRAQGDLVDAVLTGSVSVEDLVRWAQRLGYDATVPHAALLWRWPEAEGAPSLRRLETIVNQSVTQAGATALVRPRGNDIIVFCALSGAGRADAALALADVIHKHAADEYPRFPVLGGIGRPGGEISLWRDSFREAAQALNMAVRLEAERPLYFADLSVYRLLFQLEGNSELESFCREALGPLLEYEGGGDLLETLEAYCERLGNLSQTAEKLFIHRNSLLYRMERISELAGLDMNNPDTRLAVHLALKVRKMLWPSHAPRARRAG